MPQQISEDYICSMCEEEPEDILILSCSHNLCLLCASQLVFLNLKGTQLTCQICLSQTPLDTDTINCLTAMSAASTKNNLIKSKISLPPKSKSHYRQQIQRPNSQTFHMCQMHGQQIIYFCFDCNCMNICSECMLCDKHKGHQIMTLKKAAVIIQEKMKDLNREKLRIKNMMIKDREQLVMKKQQSQNQVQRQKQELKQVFDRVVRIISERYNQITSSIQQTAMRHLQIIQGSITELSQKVNLIQETVEFQNQLMKNLISKSQQLHLLQYYCEQLVYPVNLQPNLPSIIHSLSFAFQNKNQIIEQVNQICKTIQVRQEESAGQNNINQMSVIQNQNYAHQLQKMYKPTKNGKSYYKTSPIKRQIPKYNQMDDSHYSSNEHSNQNSRQYQNVNIIVGGKYKNNKKMSNDISKKQSRAKFKDNQEQLQERKLQMSRSIINATNIINKIQERTRRG